MSVCRPSVLGMHFALKMNSDPEMSRPISFDQNFKHCLLDKPSKLCFHVHEHRVLTPGEYLLYTGQLPKHTQHAIHTTQTSWRQIKIFREILAHHTPFMLRCTHAWLCKPKRRTTQDGFRSAQISDFILADLLIKSLRKLNIFFVMENIIYRNNVSQKQ